MLGYVAGPVRLQRAAYAAVPPANPRSKRPSLSDETTLVFSVRGGSNRQDRRSIVVISSAQPAGLPVRGVALLSCPCRPSAARHETMDPDLLELPTSDDRFFPSTSLVFIGFILAVKCLYPEGETATTLLFSCCCKGR
jgi:hypothetical protein